MEKLKAVTGVWRGIYNFGLSEQMPALAPVPFTLTLRQGWFGRFKGTVTDDRAPGMPGIGTITGFFSYPHIQFTKQMPICYVITPEGRSVSLRDILLEEGHACDNELPHFPIRYHGEFIDPMHARGSWRIMAGVLELPNGLTMNVVESYGKWSIEFRET